MPFQAGCRLGIIGALLLFFLFFPCSFFVKVFVFLIPCCGIPVAMAGLNHFTIPLGYIFLAFHKDNSFLNSLDR